MHTQQQRSRAYERWQGSKAPRLRASLHAHVFKPRSAVDSRIRRSLMLGVCGMLSRMIKRGVGWSRRPPMHVGSRDAGLAAASSESDVHRHAGYARIRRWCGSEDVCSVGLRDGRARPKLASGPPSSSRASRLGVFVVIRHCHSFDISSVSYTHTGVGSARD